jgi:glycosyltransferase involved in cell wall biosynthesis
VTNSHRRRDVAVVTPWYPMRHSVFSGAFVQAMVAATAPGCDSVTVYHTDGWGARRSDAENSVVWASLRALMGGGVPRSRTVAGAGLRYVPVANRSGASYATAAKSYADALRIALGDQPFPEPVVHAHVGLRGGYVALENAAPGARVFVTEHATYLDQVLAQADSRAMYDEVISRADGFFAVGEPVRGPLVDAFPHHADKISLMPNPVRFDRPRSQPVTEPRRWLFIGNLIERKGVGLLLEAFAKCHAEDPRLTLTFVGQGPLIQPLHDRASGLGISDAVTFAGALTPDQTLQAMAEHDLLVHPSRLETFGMTIVEAIAVGTPVLVTRCGGPEETLAGIETAASEFIDVTDSPDDIVEGYRRLRDRIPHDLDLPRAQHALAARYSYPTVGDIHHRIWFPDTPEGTQP